MSKMGSHYSFRHLIHKLWPKEGSGGSRPEKVENQRDLLSFRQCETYHWKAFNKEYNFALDRTSIRGLFTKLWGFKVVGVPIGAISGLPPKREKPFGCGLRGHPQSIL